MLVAECINAITRIALMHAISFSSRAVQGAVCLSVVSRHQPPPQLRLSISARAPLAFRICISYFPVSLSSLELRIRYTSFATIDHAFRLRCNAKRAARAPPPRTKTTRRSESRSRFCSAGNGARIASLGIFGISQRHLKRESNHDGHQRAAKPETESAGRGNERHMR